MQMTSLVRRFVRNESGATAIEYGLIGSLVAVAIIIGATAVGSKMNSTFSGVASKITAPAA